MDGFEISTCERNCRILVIRTGPNGLNFLREPCYRVNTFIGHFRLVVVVNMSFLLAINERYSALIVKAVFQSCLSSMSKDSRFSLLCT